MKSKSTSGVKYKWTDEDITFLRENWETMTNRDLASALGLTLTLTRMKLYELGFKRQEMEYWSEEMVEYLKNLYETIGDTEIAEIFQETFPKNKPWTKKHIEKKRRYLKLKRTKEQIAAIREDWTQKGLYKESNRKMWQTRGVDPEGNIKYQRLAGKLTPMIKINGVYIHYARYRYTQLYGDVPEGMNVAFKDGNQYNLSDDNLELLSNAELSQRNSQRSSIGLSDNYVLGIMTHSNPELRKKLRNYPGLIAAKRSQLLLQREINKQQSKP